jgi:GT2 family glycosyltransferase
LARFFEENPDVKAAGGRTIPHFEEGKPSWLTPWLEPLFACMDLGNEERAFKGKKHPFGANMAFRSEIFPKFGGFNTQLGRKGKGMAAAEEKEFFARLKKAEEPIYYVPGAALYHIMPASRTSRSYIKRQAVGIGVTERIISKGSFGRWLSSFFSEKVKTLGSLLLAIAYLFTGRTAAAGMLIRFRFWVWRGFLTGKEI